MVKVYWATKLRGFLKHISDHSVDIQFIGRDRYYERSSFLSLLKSKLVRLKLFNYIGLFQIIKITKKDCDFYGSYNRFLKCDKPYFIYLENPTALYHYALGRLDHYFGRMRFSRCLQDPNLKYIVCMSDACRTTFAKVNMALPDKVKLKTIYPLVPKNKQVNMELVVRKSYSDVLECLYCVQGKRFYTKGVDDVIDAVQRVQSRGVKIHLTIITHLSFLKENTIKKVMGNSCITLSDFNYSYTEMEEIYARTAVLIHPSSDDSFGLTVLEAMKGGCCILGSNLYAFPEMVEHRVNGILIEPKYRTFTTDNFPNPKAWGQKKKKYLSSQKKQKYTDDIEQALCYLYDNRDILCEYSKKSFEIANTKFDEENLLSQWDDVWKTLKGTINNET